MSLHNMMFNGMSGINSMSGNMAVLGDNIANVNTVSYKNSQTTFQNVMTSSQERFHEVGNGSQMQAISKNFRPGPLEATTRPTDMAISGKGFFMVNDLLSGETLYTRDGQFQLEDPLQNSEDPLYLVTPAGYRVQGINMESVGNGSGAVEDIVVQQRSPARATSELKLALNLQSLPPLADDEYNPLFSLWNGAASPPLPEGASDYQTSLTAYDDEGEPFDLRIFFGRTDQQGQHEFLVTMDPERDRRLLDGDGNRYNDGDEPEAGAGALLYGRLNFDNVGELAGLQAWNVPAEGELTADEENMLPPDENGLLSFGFNLRGQGEDLQTRLDFGAMAPDEETLQPLRTTNYAIQSATIHQQQDGFSSGVLTNVSVKDGIITGHYSNGQSHDQARVMLADFTNYRGLDPVSQNAYKATAAAGDLTIGEAGSGSFGQVLGSSLEGSNVDLARQFVNLTMTQRIFQANSKSITTADEIHQTLLRLK